MTGETVRLDDQAAAMKTLEPLRQALKGKILGVQISTIQSDVANTYFKDVVSEIRTYKTTQEEDLDIQAGRHRCHLRQPGHPGRQPGEARVAMRPS